jgi:hypothetical protein
MSHESVIASLKTLLKQDLFKLDPHDQAKHMIGESDRALIILMASTIEHVVVRWLKGKMPTLNGTEQAAIFNFEGPCGSFSNRLRMAHALGMYDREMRKRLEVIKEMRNTAAHSFARIYFDVPQIRAAVAQIFPASVRKEISGWDELRVRAAFSTFCMHYSHAVIHEQTVNLHEMFDWIRAQRVRPRPSRDK